MDYKNTYAQQISSAISWLRFPLILLIILLHGYSTVSIPGNHVVYFKVLYPFSLWLGETGVPGFFFISGFLFFLSQKSYEQKLKTRFHTLLIPYVSWNALLLAAYLIAYVVGYPQDINGKNMADYNLIDYIRLFWDRGSFDNGNFVPLLCPLWYIRNLLIMSILSPLLYYIIRYARELFLFVITIWWMLTYHNAFISQTILFFSLGAYFSILQVNPLEVFHKRRVIFLLLFVIFDICDIVTHTLWSTPINLQLHRLALIFNIPFIFLLADYCSHRGLSKKLLPNAAFIVFCVHYPIIVVLRKACISIFANASDFTHVILYWVSVIVTTIISISIYIVLNKYFPKIKNILSGNR